MAAGGFFLSSTALCTEIVDNFPGDMMRINAFWACFAVPGAFLGAKAGKFIIRTRKAPPRPFKRILEAADPALNLPAGRLAFAYSGSSQKTEFKAR